MKRIETVRLYPTARQEAALGHALHVTRHLYNAALQERRDAFRTRRITVSAKQQYSELTALRGESIHLGSVYRECEDAVLHRLELAMAAFFRRMKLGETPGYPRFKAARRWRQLEFPHGARALKFDGPQCKLRIPNVGWVKLRKGRVVPASVGRAWLVRKNSRWYAQFECERGAMPLPSTGIAVGIDRGINVLLALSNGEHKTNPEHLNASRHAIERAQRRVARRKRGGSNRRKAVAQLARLHERVARQRRDHAHKLSRAIVNAYNAIALEKLQLRNMTRSAKGSADEPGHQVAAKAALNRAMLDAAFGLISKLIAEKAENAARIVRFVDPKYSSQECVRCGYVAASNREGLRFRCGRCHRAAHADTNAAQVILKRAEFQPVVSCAGWPDSNDPRTVLSSSGPWLTLHDAA